MLIRVDRSTLLRSMSPGSFWLCYNFALTSMSLSERPFLYDIMGGSFKIYFYRGFAFISIFSFEANA